MLKFVGIDFLRGVAAFGIVGCHLVLAPRTVGGSLVTALCDFNVGLFAAVSGFLMWGKGDDDGWLAYIRKRARRLLPTYLAWSVVFVLATAGFDLLLDGGRLNPRYETMSFWWRVVFLGGSATHLWFLICLFYAQISLSNVFKPYSGRLFGVMWIVLGGLAISGCAFSSGWLYRYPLRLASFLMTGYGVGCILHGGMLDVCRRRNVMMWAVAVVVLALHVMARDLVPGFIKDWLAVVPVLLAFVGWKVKGERLRRVAAVLGTTSLGVYLVHPLVTKGFSVVVSRLVTPPFSASVVLADWLLAWGVSFSVALVLMRMPVVRRFV